ncbi:fungal specific transcription factor domain-containing protein [Aspergillus thermomutatus]|uniref:Xylanolytic transcriptional activator regulatory domain-containing protein n=1 Tax=Aspergillus thermomutatus TaxID=41047 RepID=A0A397HWL2_ASPTH|nr:uncharacterized protein CDV56_109635 [Aspergillus thermomutatus]RHZ67197.1 hypothetical protein CDV56_109635 [Aspergillus thermomutatus]
MLRTTIVLSIKYQCSVPVKHADPVGVYTYLVALFARLNPTHVIPLIQSSWQLTFTVCIKLGQRCTYTARRAVNHAASEAPSGLDQQRALDDVLPGNVSNTQKFRRIEERLDGITTLLQERLPTSSAVNSAPERMGSPNGGERVSCVSFQPEYIRSQVQIYLDHFHDQPYCVFSRDKLIKDAERFPSEIIFPLVALTSRLASKSSVDWRTYVPNTADCTDKAWNILANRYKTGNLCLPFLQGTFLMAQLDLSDGRSDRGYNSVALALRALQSAGLNRNDGYTSLQNRADQEDWKRVTWAFFMLDRNYNASRSYSICLNDKHFTLPFPSPAATGSDHEGSTPCGRLYEGPGKLGKKVDNGILACLIRLSSIWGKLTEYVFEPSNEDALPPWQSGSTLADLESDWMQFQMHFADTHRYMNVDFRRRARDEPGSRTYLSTWLCVQFLFHSIQALLHHPFVIMSKLRQYGENIPSTFLQKSYESSVIHSRWIARFVREMAEVDLKLYDPFIGYLCAIAATIQLEHTQSKKQQVSRLAKNDYKTLVAFVAGLSAYWGNMGVLADRLNKIAERRKNYGSLYGNQEEFSGILPCMPASTDLPRMSAEDEALMWDILDFSSSCSFAKTSLFEASRSSPNQHMGGVSVLPPLDDSFTSGHVVVGEAMDDQQTPRSQESGGPADSLDHILPPEWPISNTEELGLTMPDAADWMLFGGYLPEQL